MAISKHIADDVDSFWSFYDGNYSNRYFDRLGIESKRIGLGSNIKSVHNDTFFCTSNFSPFFCH